MFLKNQQVGKYNILEPIGTGGFGAVFLAEDTLIQKKVAIKVPHQQTQGLDLLLQEARLMAGLNHGNIVSVLTADEFEGTIFIVMDYIAGGSLGELLESDGHLIENRVAVLATQIARGVQHAHKAGIIHRDLRPSNVLITPEGDAKVVDFSISRALGSDPYAQTRIGSPPYMAPEHFAGKAVYASDVYSLGVMMYEMLTGTLPFFDLNPARIEELIATGRFTPPSLKRREISREMNDIVCKAMAKELSDRYSSARDLAMDLEDLLGTPANERELKDARKRIQTFQTPTSGSSCWKCGIKMPRRQPSCPKCGEDQ